MKTPLTLLLISSLGLSLGAFADDATPQRRPIPEEAIHACDGKAPGETVSFTSKNGRELSGTCTSRDGVLFAKPDWKHGGHDRHEHMRAFHDAAAKACEGKAAGDAVSISLPNGKTVDGQCQLVAVPTRMEEPAGQ